MVQRWQQHKFSGTWILDDRQWQYDGSRHFLQILFQPPAIAEYYMDINENIPPFLVSVCKKDRESLGSKCWFGACMAALHKFSGCLLQERYKRRGRGFTRKPIPRQQTKPVIVAANIIIGKHPVLNGLAGKECLGQATTKEKEKTTSNDRWTWTTRQLHSFSHIFTNYFSLDEFEETIIWNSLNSWKNGHSVQESWGLMRWS